MEKREKIEKLAQDKDEAMLLARVYDRITLAAQRNIPAATCFLSPREQLLTQQLLRGTELHFFGGAAGTERNMCCWLPDYLRRLALVGGRPLCRRLRGVFCRRQALAP